MAVLAKRAASGQVWCPSPPGVPASQSLLAPPPQSGVSPPMLQGLAIRALVLSHPVRWQEPPESHRGQCQGPVVLPLEKVGGSLVPGWLSVYALFHFSRVTSSPAGSGALPSGDRVHLWSQDVKEMFPMPFFPKAWHPEGPARVPYHHGNYCLVPLDLKKKNPRMGSSQWQNMKYSTSYGRGTVYGRYLKPAILRHSVGPSWHREGPGQRAASSEVVSGGGGRGARVRAPGGL